MFFVLIHDRSGIFSRSAGMMTVGTNHDVAAMSSRLLQQIDSFFRRKQRLFVNVDPHTH